MRALLAQNPNARQGEVDIDEFLRPFVERGWTIEPVLARTRKDAIAEILRRAHEFDAVIAAGGDGTVNTVLQAALPSRLVMVVLPLGTANDFCRSLEIPLDPETACLELAEGEVDEVDVGLVNGIAFVNAVGFGLGSKVTEELGPELKERWGVLGYPIAVAHAWRKARPFSVHIDGPNLKTRRRALQVTIANGPHYGGGMTVEDHATLDDGVFDIQLIEPVPLSRLVWNARGLRQGRGWQSPFVHAFKGSSLRLKTSRTMRVSVDGDLLTQTPIQCELRRRGLRVLRPKRSEGPIQ